MNIEFIKNTRRFSIKRNMEPIHSDEAIIKFSTAQEIQSFFKDALKNRTNSVAIQQIANTITPTYIRRTPKSPPPLTDQQRLDFLFAEIAKGNANVILKDKLLNLELEDKKSDTDTNEKGLFERIGFYGFVEHQATHLKRFFSKMVHADYSIMDTVFEYDEHFSKKAPMIIDTSSVKEYSTGWTSWDKPLEIAALGAFKTVATYHVMTFINMSNSIKLAALVGAQTELVSAQYNVTGKWIIAKKWYGSYAVRYNLKTMSFEVPWVKYKGCGPEEKLLVELKRKDRLMFHNRPIYNHKELMIPPFVSMEKYLSEYENGFPMPQYSTNKPIKFSGAMKYLYLFVILVTRLSPKKLFTSRRANRAKGIYSIMCALSLFFIIVLLNKQITDLMISLSASDLFPGADLSLGNIHVRCRNAVAYGGTGFILFYLLSSIEYFLLEADVKSSRLKRYSYLATKLLRWAAFLIFFDIVLQNLAGTVTSLAKFPIRYQTVGALIGIETYILYNFLFQRKGTDHE